MLPIYDKPMIYYPLSILLHAGTGYYAPEHERCIVWNDPTLGIDWPLAGNAPVLSAKDQAGSSFVDAVSK